MPSPDPGRILIVEDDPELSRLLTRSFRLRNFVAAVAPDPAQAIATANEAPPDYAIIDLRLGHANGMTLIKPLKVINPAMRILMLSGYASIATAVDSIKLGADHFMAKPAYVDEIMGALGIASATAADMVPASIKRSLDDLEWKQITAMLRAHGGNLTAAARALGMYRRTLQRKLKARSKVTGKDVLAEIRKTAPLRRRRALRALPAA